MINVIISASKQSGNACVMGDSEQDHCFKIAQEVVRLLGDYDCKTCLVPNLKGSEAATLNFTVKTENNFVINNPANMSLFVEIHTDAGYNAHGCSAFYVSEGGRGLANKLYQRVSKLTPGLDVGVIKRENLFVINKTKSLACLIELSFHDQKLEAQFVHDRWQDFAKAISLGIMDYAALKLKPAVDNFDDIINDAFQSQKIVDPNFWTKNAIVGKQIDGNLVRKLVCALIDD